MPFVPSPLERLALLRLNAGPASMLDVLGAVNLKALLTAKGLGIIDELTEGSKTAGELAAAFELDTDRLESLLELLVSARYLKRKGAVYRLTSGTRKWISSDSATNTSAFLRWWDQLVLPYWAEHLDDIIEGAGEADLYQWVGTQPDGWKTAQEGFEATASLVLPAFVRAMPVPERPVELLDAGGGHGLYSVALCKQHPELKAVVFDFPEALGRARDNIVSAGLEDRIRVRPGDITTDELGDGYGLALLANVIHGFGPEANIAILGRVHAALRPGARVVILDQLGRVPGRMGKALHSVLDLAYRGIGEGRTYDSNTVKGWLEASGFDVIGEAKLRKAPGNALISGLRPA